MRFYLPNKLNLNCCVMPKYNLAQGHLQSPQLPTSFRPYGHDQET